MRILISTLLLASLSACTWVKMAPGGNAVRVADAKTNLSSCARRGEIAVSVHNRIGPVERNELKVKDELEVLARNEAPSLNADTVQAINAPSKGEQRFVAYQCGNARLSDMPQRGDVSERKAPTEAQTAPIRDE